MIRYESEGIRHELEVFYEEVPSLWTSSASERIDFLHRSAAASFGSAPLGTAPLRSALLGIYWALRRLESQGWPLVLTCLISKSQTEQTDRQAPRCSYGPMSLG